MKVIIAGGRDFIDFEAVVVAVRESGFDVSEVVSGGADGADMLGEQYAFTHAIDLTRMPANWKKHGKAAGPIRNQRMADYADALIAMPGGRGTRNMVETMRRARKPFYAPWCEDKQ